MFCCEGATKVRWEGKWLLFFFFLFCSRVGFMVMILDVVGVERRTLSGYIFDTTASES